MGSLPDDLWLQIVQIGIRKTRLLPRDLCSLAIVSKQMNRIAQLDSVWKEITAHEFPESSQPSVAVTCYSLRWLALEGSDVPWKRRYRMKYEKVKALKRAVHERNVLRATSSLNVLQRERQILEKTLQLELGRFVSSQKELENLERSSRTTVALQIWQPQAVTTRHEQVVQQIPINLAGRRNQLWLEISVCKQRIQAVENNLKFNKYSSDQRRSEVNALKYNPVMDTIRKDVIVGKKLGVKRKSVDTASQLGSFVSRN